jgi:hypothetical protein
MDPLEKYKADFARLRSEAHQAKADKVDDKARPKGSGAEIDTGVRLDDFYAYMPMHSYLYAPTRELWPADASRAPEDAELTDATAEDPGILGDRRRIDTSAKA